MPNTIRGRPAQRCRVVTRDDQTVCAYAIRTLKGEALKTLGKCSAAQYGCESDMCRRRKKQSAPYGTELAAAHGFSPVPSPAEIMRLSLRLCHRYRAAPT